MAENKKSFILYADLIKVVDKLPDDVAGKLFKIVLKYVNDQEVCIDDILLEIAFEPIKNQLKRDLKKWENLKEKRSKAGKISAEKRKQNSTNSTHVESVKDCSTLSTVNVNDNVTVNDTVTVTVNDILLEKETKEYIGQNENFQDVDFVELEPQEKKEKSSAKKETKFSVPTLEEVQKYCIERNNAVDAQNFIDFYESKGWVVGKSKMKSWKAAVRTWEKNSNNKNLNQNGQQQERFVGRQSIDTIQHNATVGYEAAERVRKQMLNNSN